MVLNVPRRQPCLLLAQAAALPRLCSQLTLASGLRELVLDLRGRAADAVTTRIAALSRLTQVDSLQLRGIAIDAEASRLVTTLSPLSRLTQLALRFDWDHWDTAEQHTTFPWERAVCVLSSLQDLHVSTDIDEPQSRVRMFKGALPAAMSRLTALRHLAVLGMDEWDARDDSDQLLLPALPALETAALRLHTLCGQVPSLCDQRQVTVSHLVSLSIALRVEVDLEEPYADTHIPAIIAPALTELMLDDIKLAPDSQQLSWLPGLPKLRRLVLKDVKTAAKELPGGALQCSRLTELVLSRFQISYSHQPADEENGYRPECKLRSLPDAGPYLNQRACLSLVKNGFTVVPHCLAAATALTTLDLGDQNLRHFCCAQHAEPVRGLHVLDNLTQLRCVRLIGFRKCGAGLRRFRAVRPDVELVLQKKPLRMRMRVSKTSDCMFDRL